MLKGLKQFNLPELEEKVLKFWKDHNIFGKSLELRGKAKPFRFFEGPPTANGRPGLHHVLARAFKDIICRYKQMKGFFVLRRAGWDTHGLPVEIEVEKKLGIKHKQEIEKFGIAEFNAQAKMSVWTYKSDWEKLTERIGFWLDFDHPYITYDNKYIESLWWVFSEIDKRGLLNKLHKIVPWCPRCQTALSNHELGQPGAYRTAKDPSVYVKFRLKGKSAKGGSASGGKKEHEYLLVWTTTPWTLPANVAVAVNPGLTYTKYKVGDEFYWSYHTPPVHAGKDGRKEEMEVVEKLSGKKLVGEQYEPLYPNEGAHEVLGAGFVSTEEGTGLVHIAPAYGEDDLRVAGKGPVPVTINDEGKMLKGFPGAGKFIKQADDDIIADLEARGFLYSKSTIEHEYPFCWRCSTPLIYFARKSWFIEISKLNKEMLEANQKINWIPEHIKEGRFGEWLKDPKDWSIARNRYWGTPLPIWECEKNQEHRLFVGSLEDLDTHAYNRNRYFVARHCEGEHNVAGVLASGPEKNGHGARLTEKGTVQAEKIAMALKKPGIDVIYSSPLKRAVETAKIISKATGAPVKTDKRLSEVEFGTFNGSPVGKYWEFFANDAERFVKAPPGGENLSDVKKRMIEFWKEIDSENSGKNILIVSHGDPIWVMEGAMSGLNNQEIEKAPYLKVGEYRETEYHNWPFSQEGALDIHRPFVDAVILKCPECGEKMRRIKEVADVWFDSGAMPFAQWHYPFENKKLIDSGAQFPADYIAEGMDQTRGWFYTLLAVSVLLERGLAYRNVISFGLLLDKNGQKMSKSKGNVVDPWDVIKKYGADAVRWYFYTVNAPGEYKKFDELDLGKTLRKVFLLAYNSFAFYQLNSDAKDKPIAVLDEWILARTHQTIEGTTARLEHYDVGGAAKLIEELVDDCSRWYIRRSRKNVSPKTLALVLGEIAKLMAPFAPFFSEGLYKSLTADPKASVHLADWPKADKKKINKKMLEAMAEVRRVASLGLSEREKAGIKVRQPLAALKVKSKKLKIADKELLEILKDEVNVKEVVFDPKIQGEVELDTNITAELKNEGILRDLARTIQGLRHDAKYQPKDAIALLLDLPPELLKIIEVHESTLKNMVHAKQVIYRREKFDAELSTKLDDADIWVAVRKA